MSDEEKKKWASYEHGQLNGQEGHTAVEEGLTNDTSLAGGSPAEPQDTGFGHEIQEYASEAN